MDFPPSNRRATLAEMLNPELKLGGGSESNSAAQGPRRRQSMAEMLRESSLLGNTVSLVDAVESAQAAAARKAEALETPPSPVVAEESTPATPPPVVEVASAPVLRETPFAVPLAPIEQAIAPSSQRYSLYARIAGRWIWQCELQASDHADGFRQALAWLKPEHNAFPIRLEQDEFIAA